MPTPALRAARVNGTSEIEYDDFWEVPPHNFDCLVGTTIDENDLEWSGTTLRDNRGERALYGRLIILRDDNDREKGTSTAFIARRFCPTQNRYLGASFANH